MKPVSIIPFAVAVTMAILFWIHALINKSGFLLLDYVNLPFHEFGHLFFGILGQGPGIWGGTLAQLLIPVIIGVNFWIRQEPLGVAFGGFWFGENFLNISVYLGDAQKMLLPLVGGGEHDWNLILSSLNLLNQCGPISSMVRLLGWGIMVGAVLWLGLVFLGSPDEEEKQ
jgi:hypothetical protein